VLLKSGSFSWSAGIEVLIFYMEIESNPLVALNNARNLPRSSIRSTTRVVPRRSAKAPNHTWHYFQEGFEDPIVGQSFDELVDAVLQFRIDHELDTGDPENDVENYVRNLANGAARANKRTPTAEDQQREDQRSLLDKVRTWSKLAKNHPWQNEAQSVAEKRASTCAACPANRAVEAASSCAPCISALNRAQVILTSNRTTEAKPGVCTSIFQDNRVAAFMPKAELARSISMINDETPEACWLRAL
jgi:hypothetical protein